MDDRCKTCRHGDLRWDEEPCESCCGANDGYEPRGDRMDRYDSYTDKFLRDTQYGILDTDVPDTNVGDMISRRAAIMDAESWVAVDEYEKNLQKKVVEWLKEFPPAELGTDTISRQAAIDAIDEISREVDDGDGFDYAKWREYFCELPSTQPEIIYCKDCKHHWTYKSMDSMPIEICDLEQTFYDAEHDFCSLAERRKNG